MQCQVADCSKPSGHGVMMHILYKFKTHHFRMCKNHHAILRYYEGRWNIWWIRNGQINVRVRP